MSSKCRPRCRPPLLHQTGRPCHAGSSTAPKSSSYHDRAAIVAPWHPACAWLTRGLACRARWAAHGTALASVPSAPTCPLAACDASAPHSRPASQPAPSVCGSLTRCGASCHSNEEGLRPVRASPAAVGRWAALRQRASSVLHSQPSQRPLHLLHRTHGQGSLLLCCCWLAGQEGKEACGRAAGRQAGGGGSAGEQLLLLPMRRTQARALAAGRRGTGDAAAAGAVASPCGAQASPLSRSQKFQQCDAKYALQPAARGHCSLSPHEGKSAISQPQPWLCCLLKVDEARRCQ